MKCDPATIDALLARFPGAKVMGMPSGDRAAGGGKVIGDHIASAGKLGGRRPNVRKVGPNGENKTELDYYRKYLEPRLLAGELVAVEFESMRFRLVPSFGANHKAIWFTPDYILTHHDKTIEAHEIKGGHMEEDGHMKAKMFADKYRHIPLFICRRGKGGWSVERIGRG